MSRRDDVQKMIPIPRYFEEIIVPQLGSYYDTYPVDFEAKPVVCCPLHDEDTPSCRYYEETNSFYCFGCRRGGSVLNLHMYFMERMNGHKPSLNAAVDFLYNYFIQGNNAAQAIKKPTKLIKGEVENTNADIAKFMKYSYALNDMVGKDNTLSDESKVKVYEHIDCCDVLVEKNEIAVTEAIKSIDALVRAEINKL